MRNILFTLVLILAAPYSFAAPYTVDKNASTITFAGKHAGDDFSGTFGEWTAAIDFDPANLAASHITADIKAASAKTGNAMYDGTMPQADWFDVKDYPDITFVSRSIVLNADKSYTAAGDLTIRNITKAAELKFTLSDLSQKPVRAKGTLTVNRLDYNLGKKSDAVAEWVDKPITLTIDLTASPTL